MRTGRYTQAASVVFGGLFAIAEFGCGDSAAPVPISVTVAPGTAAVLPGNTGQFTATVANDPADKGVTWSVDGAGCAGLTCGSVAPTSSASGAAVTYTPPTTIPNPALVTLSAVSVADNTKSGTAAVTVAPVEVSVSPPTTSVAVNGTVALTATVENDPGTSRVNWTVTGSGCFGTACGTVAPTGSASGDAVTYTAPASVPTPPMVAATATSVADNTKSASASITIAVPVAVEVTPTVAGVDVSTSQQFTATLTNDPANKGVTWTVTGDGCSGAACGTVSPASSLSGAPVSYTAPATVPDPADVTVTATSAANPSGTANAQAVITTPGVITVAVFPSSARVFVRGGRLSRTFVAYVFHDASNSGVTWSAGTGSLSPTSTQSGEPTTYTAILSGIARTTFVAAKSVADPTKSDTVKVQLLSSCPIVYSWDGKHWRLDSGTFGGAIVRALAKTDVDNLDFATAQDGVLRLKLTDELAETDYVDGLTVLAVDHDSGTSVAPDGFGTLHSLGSLTQAARAVDFNGADVLPLVSAADGSNWESSSIIRDTARAADLTDGIQLSFVRPAGAQAARLVVDANNSPWAAAMMLAFVSAHGRATQAWYDSLNAAPERTREAFAKLLRQAFLQVSVQTAGRWETQGAVWEAGPEVSKRQVVSLDLSKVVGDTVRIRLASVPNFWIVDRVALDFSAPRPFTVTELAPTRALDRRGRNVRDELAVSDGGYYRMEPGDFAEVDYRVPELRPGQARSFVLRSSGYYRIHTSEAGKPDLALLKRVQAGSSAISRVSISLMNRTLLATRKATR